MIQQMTNRQLAQEINARIGNAPIPFDSVYSIALQIYQELGGEENDFDSVYSILLEILPLAESVAKKTSISEVDELPDAYDNNNIYRLSSDDKVYMSKHVSTDYTNRLPDEQQIDKAILYLADDEPSYYKGAWKFILNDGEVNGYGWLETYPDSDKWYFNLTQDDAVNTTINTKCFNISYHDATIDLDAHTATIDSSVSSYTWEGASTVEYEELYPIPAIYNAPESACIGNAQFEVDGGGVQVYDGTQRTITVDGSEITVYGWKDLDDWYLYSAKPASEIYFQNVDGQYYIYTDTKFYYVEDETVEEKTEMWGMYIPQLNAPDSEQIGKANFSVYSYYTGIEKTIVLSDRTFNVYLWGDDEESPYDWYYTTLKPANQIYGGSDLMANGFDSFAGWVVDGNTVTNTDITYDEFANDCIISITDANLSVHTVPYQRVIENWEWKQIPTMDDVPQTTVINIASTGATEMAKLNDFTETGIYNDIKLTIKIPDGAGTIICPATLIVQSKSPEIWQWIKYYTINGDDSYFYQERILFRQTNPSGTAWLPPTDYDLAHIDM